MKKNAILFGIFLLLMCATYFFQEKRVTDEYAAKELADRLLKDEVTHLKLPHAEAEKKEGRWYQGKDLLSHNAFKIIEKKLTEIKKVRDIKGEWKNYFPHPFSFEINHEKWTIGDMSLDKQDFYIARGDQIYLAVIEGESTHLTQDEHEIAAMKLNELVGTLSKPYSDLKETQLFRFYTDMTLSRIVLSVDGSLPFELDFEKNETHPAPVAGIKPYSDLRGKFLSLITQITIKEELPYSEKLKFKKMGSLDFLSEKKNVTWELWLKGKDSADAVIIDSTNQKAFQVIGGTLRIFFIRVQDYWDKKVIPTTEFKSFNRLTTTFSQDDKSVQVTVLNREPLVFEARGYKVDTQKMDRLFKYIFNLGEKDQAERVSFLSKSEKKQLLSESHLRVEVMGQELIMWRKLEELIVVNLTQGFKAHFNLVDENFHGTFGDMLK